MVALRDRRFLFLLAKSGKRLTAVADQKKVVVQFLVGRCLSRAALLHLRKQGQGFFGNGLTEKQVTLLAKLWASGAQVYGLRAIRHVPSK